MPINCVVSPMASFNVINPCLRTSIQLNGMIPDNSLVMYQTGVQIVSNFLTNKFFPDTESLRIASLSPNYPTDACGPNSYMFVSQLTNLGPIPFLSFDANGNIYFKPS